MKRRYCVISLFLLLALFSCLRDRLADQIIPPPSYPLSRDIIGYGVVEPNYTHLLDRRDDTGVALELLRKGTIIEVIERRLIIQNEKEERWVFATSQYSGWLRENEVRIYPTKAQAETAAVMSRQTQQPER